MAQDQVQLKREEVVGNDIVLQDINPKTKTNSIEDSTKGVPLDQTLALVKNMINNKLARVVNSVNGRTGVVVLDANDVGLGNVDNVSFGDIKRWVIEYLGDIFETKRIIIREWLTDIQTITGSNDKVYANCAFFTEKGKQTENNYMSYIGFIWWDNEHSVLQETHVPIRVVGFTDKSLIYNVDMTAYGKGDFRGGGLGVNIWSGEDALKIYSNYIGHEDFDPADLARSGLYIDKTKIVPNVYFFDGAYGPLSENPLRAVNGLVYWSSDPNDLTVGDLDLITININGNPISLTASSGRTPNMLHTPQEFKEGDIIICNFAYDDYINLTDTREHTLYEGMVDALTCRQPAIGRVTQVGHGDTPYIIDFYQFKPNVGHGLKLITTNGDIGINDTGTMLGIDEMSKVPRMGDGTNIGVQPVTSNISGINVFDKNGIGQRAGEETTSKSLYTVYPSGKSNNLLDDNTINSDSTFITPNFSLCVIPSYDMLTYGDSVLRPMSNWNAKAPNSTVLTNTSWGHKMNLLGVNLEKTVFGTSLTDEPHRYARNISGLRVNTDTDELHESWFGFGSDTSTELYEMHSGGLSVNVGDFLGIGTAEELAAETHTTMADYYNEGKVNVRINRMYGLSNIGANSLGINLAQGDTYQSSNWFDGGLYFVDDGHDKGLLGVNTGRSACGLTVLHTEAVDVQYTNYGRSSTPVLEHNVLAVSPYTFSHKKEGTSSIVDVSGIQLQKYISEEDIAHLLPIRNIYTAKLWESSETLKDEASMPSSVFDDEHIYIAGGKRYIFVGGTDVILPYIRFYTDSTEYNEVATAIESGQGVDDIPYTTLIHQCHVLITPQGTNLYNIKASMYMPGEDDLRYPDFNHDGTVDAVDASQLLTMYSKIIGSEEVYSDNTHTQFYTDPELTTPVQPVENKGYRDKNQYIEDPHNPDHKYYRLYVGTKVFSTDVVVLECMRCGTWEMTAEDIMNGDIDRDGAVNAVDSSRLLSFYAKKSSSSYFPEGISDRECWRIYLKDFVGINVTPTAGGLVEVLNYNFRKGVRLRFNTLKGLTTEYEYTGANPYGTRLFYGNDIRNSLAVKISDKSAGDLMFDPTTAGAIRYGSNGYLGVRINNSSNFVAALPTQNTIFNVDDMTIGTKGLHIDEDNVLGIQLTRDGKTDNGELKIDEDGCLRLTNPSGGSREPLTISGSYASGNPQAVAYNGNSRVDIVLGPGLCWATPPEPPVQE